MPVSIRSLGKQMAEVMRSLGRQPRTANAADGEPVHSTNLATPPNAPKLIWTMEIQSGITAAYRAELEQLSQQHRFNTHKAMARKAEIEARYVFLQRVYDEPERLEIMLDVYAAWVGRMSTPRGLAEFVLEDHGGGLVGGGKGLVEGVEDP